MQINEINENYFFEYNGPSLIIFKNIILDKYGDVHLIHQNPNKEITLFTDNRDEEIMENFQKLLNIGEVIVTRIYFPNSIKRFKFLNQIGEFFVYYDRYDVRNPKEFLDWQRAILEKMIGNPTRLNIEKLTGELKMGKKIMAGMKIS
jgi:hypothetical protein